MPILELHAINPLTIAPFGIGLYYLLMHIPIIFGFGMAAYWVIKYLKKFYADRPIPEEWKFFWLAMVWGTVHELIETPLLYQWIIGQFFLVLYFVVEIVAGIYLIRGSYLLAKKYITR